MGTKNFTEKQTEHVEIAYLVYESNMARMERTQKRLIFALVISIAVIFLSNLVWLFVWNQYDYIGESAETTTTTTYQQDGNGVNIIGDENEVKNGAD